MPGGARATRRQDAAQRTVAPLVDLLAPVFVWAYVVVAFEPFYLRVSIPGTVPSVLLPAFGIGILLLTPSDRIRKIPVSFPVLGLVAWLSISLLWSELPGHTMFLVRSELLPMLVLAAVVGTMQPRRVARTLVAVFLVFIAWSIFASLAFSMGRLAMIEDIEQVGFRGTFIHKNLLGAFAIYGLCMVVAFVRGPRRTAALVLCFVAIVGSRSATVAAGMLGVLFVWAWMSAIDRQRTPRERQFLLFLSVASVIAAVLIVLGLLPAMLNLYDKDLTFSGRTDIWTESLVTISEEPVLGYGFGGVWSDPTAPLTADLHHRITFEAAHSHNAIVELLMGGGVVAVVFAAVIVVQATSLAFASLGRSESKAFGQWALLTMIALAIMGLAEPLFEGPHLALLVVVWVMLARVRIDQRSATNPSVRRPTTW
ncbi:MAG: O-antigen ligase family protein [Acidimicrobiales bacterium]